MTDLPRLVSLACHDLRTPLATIQGFARTLPRVGDLNETESRYVEMIAAAAEELGEIVDVLGLVARIEAGRYEPARQPVDSLRLAERAGGLAGDGVVEVEGTGGEVELDVAAAERAVAALAQAAQRHGGVARLRLDVEGRRIVISPVEEAAAPIVLGEDLRDLGAAAARAVLEAQGASLSLARDAIVVQLPG
jgi:signal transduction histidine kinase